jgi:hypothetical protein
MKRWGSVVATGVLLGIASCAPTTEVAATAPVAEVVGAFPAEVNAFVMNAALARQIAKRCSSEFAYNSAAADRRIDGFDRKYAGNSSILSVRGREYDAIDRSEVMRQLAVYTTKRKIAAGNDASWCPAGRAEIAEKTEIGTLLIQR